MHLSSLEELRATVRDEDRSLLDLCWTQYIPEKGNLKVREAHFKLGKPAVDASAERLTGALIRKDWGNTQGEEYKLTHLGALASSEGVRLEKLIVSFLVAMRDFYEGNHEKTLVKSSELLHHFESTGTKLTPDDLNDLGKVLSLGVNLLRLSTSGRQTDGSWYVNISDDIEDIRRIPNFADYVTRELVKDYTSYEPVSEVDRRNKILLGENFFGDVNSLNALVQSKSNGVNENLDFKFIVDSDLRAICLTDWHEAVFAHKYALNKACIILCGTVVEAMLLDRLERTDQDQIKQACKKHNIDHPLVRMGIDDLATIGKELQIIRSSSEHLVQFLREYRNLVHPARQRKEQTPLTHNDAITAKITVCRVAREISAKTSNGD